MVQSQNRNNRVDIIRGILIILVVMGHFTDDVIHDVIFLFHMPLFFIISGFLITKEHLLKTEYMKSKIQKLMVPYVVYLLVDLLLIRRDYSVKTMIRALWGGRAVAGVYWYITCFVFALFLLAFLLRRIPDRAAKGLILVWGGTAVLESYFVDRVQYLKSPGIPLNLDVSLMALAYIKIGFFYKDEIKNMLDSDSVKYDIAAGIITVALAAFCRFIYNDGNKLYYFDMKPVYYKELLGAIIIPCAFGVVLVRIVHHVVKIRCLNILHSFFVLCGQTTIPIMFMHIPLNHWKDDIGYGRLAYMVIGIGIPLIFNIAFNRILIVRKMFGLSEISDKNKAE